MYTESISIQEDSVIIQTHPATLNLPPKGKNQGIHNYAENPHIYVDIPIKIMCTCDYEHKTHIQEQKEIKK